MALLLVVTASALGVGLRERDETRPQAIELEFWEIQTSLGAYTKVAGDLVSEYSSRTEDVTVDYQVIPWDGWYQLFFTAVLSGKGPDVSGGAFPQPIQYAQLGEVLYLDSILVDWRREAPGFVETFVPGSLELYRYEGRQAGLPWFVDPRVILYRRDLFEEAGVASVPRTWTELLDVGRLLRDHTNVAPLVFKAGDIMSTHVLLYFMLQAGTGMVDEEGRRAVDTTGIVQALSFLRRLYREGIIAEDVVRLKGDEARQRYLDGRAAMVFSYPFTRSEPDHPILGMSSVLPVMSGPTESDERRVLSWIAPIMAYRQTDAPEEAKDFIRWWIENNAPVWTVGRFPFLPARTSMWSDSVLRMNPLLEEVATLVMPHAVLPTWPRTNLYPQFHRIEGENLLGDALVSVLVGRQSPEEAAARLQRELERVFADSSVRP